MNATDKDLNVQKVLKTTEKNFPSTSKALGNVDRAFDNTKRMKTSYDADSRVLMRVTFKCARSGCHESSGEAKQRRSKKVGCNYELVCTIRRDQPDVVHYEERHGHSGHVPGSTEDLKYLSLHPDIVKLAKEYYINAGMSPQQILYALQANGKVNAITDGKVSRHFLPSLKDIQNIVKQLKVEKQFHPNDDIEEDIPENIDVHLRKRIGVLHGSDPLNGVECANNVRLIPSNERAHLNVTLIRTRESASYDVFILLVLSKARSTLPRALDVDGKFFSVVLRTF
ncbi:hypothetical protein KSW81_002205 [Nannochloris sp. 'desiccata']|nr:hypothetical protein KSW81_002205 [Chlorella desiccata (nom. nud.)]